MRFSKWPYGEQSSDIATLERLFKLPTPLQSSPEPLALFGNLPDTQPKRAMLWTPEQAYLRAKRAKEWRAIRQQIATLPIATKTQLLTDWNSPSARRCFSGTPRNLKKFMAMSLVAGIEN